MLSRCLALLALTALLSIGRNAAAFRYQPLPEIPSVEVKTNSFVENLDTICSEFAKRCAAPGDAEERAICAASRPTDAAIASAEAELKRPGEEALKASKASMAYLASVAKTACSRIQSGKKIEQHELTLLRVLRDNAWLRDVALFTVSDVIEKSGRGGGRIDEAVRAAKEDGGRGQGAVESIPTLPGFEGIEGRLIQGLAEFLAKRAKEEALAYLQKTLTEELCKAPADQFYPATCAAIRAVDKNRSLAAIRATLKAAVEIDLRRLPDFSLAYVVAESKATEAVKNVAFGGRIAMSYLAALRSNREPLEVARGLGALPLQDCEQKDCAEVGHAFRFASAVFYAAAQGGANWNKYFEAMAPTSGAGGARVAVVATALVLLAEARWLETDHKGQAIALTQMNAFIAEPVSLWLEILRLRKDWKDAVDRSKSLGGAERTALFLQLAEESLAKVSVVVTACMRLQNAKGSAEQLLATMQYLVQARASLINAEYAGSIAYLNLAVQEMQRGHEGKALPEAWTKHVGLLAEIAEAKSAGEVSAALEGYAEPLGSYATKYRARRIALNGLVGIFGGAELISASGAHGGSGFFGGFAPVGLHLTTPLGASGAENDFHLGLLLSAIDLGAITTYRFNEDLSGDLQGTDPNAKPEAAPAPQIGFEQIVAPGAFLTLGIAGSPFTVGAGVSIAPRLRKITQAGAQVEASALRMGLSLSIDVPILFFM
jgi:hypothetical protein